MRENLGHSRISTRREPTTSIADDGTKSKGVNRGGEKDFALTLTTDCELAVLQHLWQRKIATLADLKGVPELNDCGSASVDVIVQAMLKKGLVERVADTKPAGLRAAMSESEMCASTARELVDAAFGGSVVSLVRYALSKRKLNSHDSAELMEMLSQGKASKLRATTVVRRATARRRVPRGSASSRA